MKTQLRAIARRDTEIEANGMSLDNHALEEDEAINDNSKDTSTSNGPVEPDVFGQVLEKMRTLEREWNRESTSCAYETTRREENQEENQEIHAFSLREYIEFLLKLNENANLNDKNAELIERANNLSYIMSDLNTKVKDLENGKKCLITCSNKNSARKSKPSTVIVIAGDSMLTIKGRKLSHRHNTYVKYFPRATVEDLSDYIKPSLRRKPDEIILDIGTKNVKSEEPKKIAETRSYYRKWSAALNGTKIVIF